MLFFISPIVSDFKPPHSEKNVAKAGGHSDGERNGRRYYLPSDVDQYAFTKFTNIYFRAHVWGMKREPIKTPFLAKTNEADYQESLAIFKLVSILIVLNNNRLGAKQVPCLFLSLSCPK